MRSNSPATRVSLFAVPEKQSAFHPRAQRNAFRRRDVRLQSRSFARWNQSMRRSPTPTDFTDIIGDYFPILHPVPGNRTHDYVGRFELRIRVRERQATIRVHNKASSVAALCGHNPKLSPFAICSRRKQRQIDMRGRDDASSWWTRLRTTIRSQFLQSERNPCAMHLNFLPRYWMR